MFIHALMKLPKKASLSKLKLAKKVCPFSPLVGTARKLFSTTSSYLFVAGVKKTQQNQREYRRLFGQLIRGDIFDCIDVLLCV